MYSFNRTLGFKPEKKDFKWEGPFSWPGFKEITGLDEVPLDKAGIYLWTFECKNQKDKYLIYSAGAARTIKARFLTDDESHQKYFENGWYTILDPESAKNGVRKEIWSGWPSQNNPPSWIRDSNVIKEIEKKQNTRDPLSDECIKKIWAKYNYNKYNEFKEILSKHLGDKNRRHAEYTEKFKHNKIVSEETGLEINLSNALENQLSSMRVFIAEEKDERIRFRMEATLMHGLYYSKKPWSELADRGMQLREVRYNYEDPILAKNTQSNKDVKKIYGLFEEQEI